MPLTPPYLEVSMMLTPTVPAGQIRVVMSWGKEPPNPGPNPNPNPNPDPGPNPNPNPNRLGLGLVT